MKMKIKNVTKSLFLIFCIIFFEICESYSNLYDDQEFTLSYDKYSLNSKSNVINEFFTVKEINKNIRNKEYNSGTIEEPVREIIISDFNLAETDIKQLPKLYTSGSHKFPILATVISVCILGGIIFYITKYASE